VKEIMRSGPLVSTLVCALALAGCNGHRYGFFGDTDGEGGSTDETNTTDMTTVSPTTVQPTTVQPTTITDPTTTTDPTVTATLPTTITTETTDTTTVDPTGGLECGVLVLPSEVPVQGFGGLGGQPDGFSLSCGGVGGSDLSFVWVAPFSGRFLVETAGSSFDTLLAVIDGFCFGPELGCNDDGAPDLTSRVEVDLFAGQTVTLVVDSFGQQPADVVVTVSEVPVEDKCPDGDFGSLVPFQTSGQTAGAPNLRAGFCGGESSPEIEALWTAPIDGVFRFQVIDADFDPLMYVTASCFDPEFDCSDNVNGLFPQIDLFLAAGQQVVIVVDGASGTSGKFTLQIDQIG
jgi:hypothetical protein